MTCPDAASFPPVDQTIDLLQELLKPEDRVRLFWLLGNEGHWQERFEPVEGQREAVEAVVVSCFGDAIRVEIIRRE